MGLVWWCGRSSGAGEVSQNTGRRAAVSAVVAGERMAVQIGLGLQSQGDCGRIGGMGSGQPREGVMGSGAGSLDSGWGRRLACGVGWWSRASAIEGW